MSSEGYGYKDIAQELVDWAAAYTASDTSYVPAGLMHTVTAASRLLGRRPITSSLFM